MRTDVGFKTIVLNVIYRHGKLWGVALSVYFRRISGFIDQGHKTWLGRGGIYKFHIRKGSILSTRTCTNFQMT